MRDIINKYLSSGGYHVYLYLGLNIIKILLLRTLISKLIHLKTYFLHFLGGKQEV